MNIPPPSGHNNPPSMVDSAKETMHDVSAWLAEHPVVQTEGDAREAKLFLDRGKLALKDLDDERDGKVRPLNEQVKEINAGYKAPRVQLETVLAGLSDRLSSFLKEEKRKREEAAREASRIAEEAESRAREAERLEREAMASASAGELGIDVASHVVHADEAFSAYQKAERQAALAERDTKVKVGGGFSRAVSLRQKETLTVLDPSAAITAIGMTEDIREAIIKSARAYRTLRGKLPTGVTAEYTEEL